MKRWLISLVALVVAAQASAFTIESGHPRVMLLNQDADLARIRARVGVVDGTNMTTYASEANSYATMFTNIKAWIASIGASSTNRPMGCASTPLDDTRGRGSWRQRGWNMGELGFITAMYAHTPASAEFIQFSALANEWADSLIAECSCGFDPPPDGTYEAWYKDANSTGEYAEWGGFIQFYDFVYDWMVPWRRDAVSAIYATEAIFLESQVTHAVRSGQGMYYKGRFHMTGPAAFVTTIWGDDGTAPYQSQLNALKTNAEDRLPVLAKVDSLTRVGVYSAAGGYYESAVDGPLMRFITNATNYDAVKATGEHYYTIPYWGIYGAGKDFRALDATADGFHHKVLGNRVFMWSWDYAASRRDGTALWFLDQKLPITDTGYSDYNRVHRIIYDDPTIQRVNPNGVLPNLRAFTDFSPSDGFAHQFAYMRYGGFQYTGTAADTTIQVTCHAGPHLAGHDLAIDGHVSILRGDDRLSLTGGAYDATDFSHGKYFFETGLSRNVIRIIHPSNPYDSVFLTHRDEGLPGHSPIWSSSFTRPEYVYSDTSLVGYIRRGDNQADVQYCMMDLTRGYPNNTQPSFATYWPSGQYVGTVTRSVFMHGKYIVDFDRIRGAAAGDTAIAQWRVHDINGPRWTDGSSDWPLGVPAHPVQYGGTPGQGNATKKQLYWDRSTPNPPGSRIFYTVADPTTAEVWRVGGANSLGCWNKGWNDYLGSTGRGCTSSCDDFPDSPPCYTNPGTGGSFPWEPTTPPRDYLDPSFEFFAHRTDVGPKNMMADSCYMTCAEVTEVFGAGDAGFWRVETRLTGATNYVLAQVIEVAPSSQSLPNGAVSAINVDAEQAGVVIEDANVTRVVVVSRDETLDGTINYTFSSVLPTRHAVSDLLAGWYEVRQDGDLVHESLPVREGSGLLVFDSQGGGTFDIKRLESLLVAAE
jgi:hypothetical protein